MRNAFISAVVAMAHERDDIFLLCGDLGYSVLEEYSSRYPDRFLNAGVAEQNMVEMAAGLALEGFNVFTYSIGNFATLRCLEQIRYDVCYHNLSVKVVAVGGGFAYGNQGASHHATEDLGILRTLPNMRVAAPCDPIEAQLVAEYFSRVPGPGYVRLNRSGEPPMHSGRAPATLSPGELYPIKVGRGVAVLATGAVASHALNELNHRGLDWSLYSVPFVCGLSLTSVRVLADHYEEIVTLEEHQLTGGLGSLTVEALSDAYSRGQVERVPKVHRVGIRGTFMDEAGTQEFLRARAGITLSEVIARLDGQGQEPAPYCGLD